MKQNKQSETGWKIFSIGLGAALIMAAVLLLFSNWRILTKAMDSIKYRKLAEANLASLEERRLELQNKVDSLETESGVDRQIRERFPVAKEGEEVIMIIDNNASNQQEEEISDNINFWQKLKNWWDAE